MFLKMNVSYIQDINKHIVYIYIIYFIQMKGMRVNEMTV